jgi:uncharacterized protein with NAD-binding domain and iron-sulfur cluster
LTSNGVRERVAILGGGVAGLTAAFELTSTAKMRERYDVTVYQYGWRLGGKGASGRNQSQGWRIEEHGMHLWFGAYQNAFSLMRRCYDELGRPPDAPLATVDEAFQPMNQTVLWDDYGDTWVPAPFSFPVNDRVPGDGTPVPGFWDMAWRTLLVAWDEWCTVHPLAGEPGWERRITGWAKVAIRVIERPLALPARLTGDSLLFLARQLAEQRARHPAMPGEGIHRRLLCQMLGTFRDWVWKLEVEPRLDDGTLRRFFCQFDLFVTMLIGIVAEDVQDRGFERLDDFELRDWLRRYGAREVTLAGPLVRAWYCGAFAFLDGDTTRPNLAAGASVHGMIRQQLGYKGSLLYRMQAAMGDVVVAPIYEVLLRRGVHFEFFNRVTNLGADDGAITGIDLVQQVQVAGDGIYRPLVNVKGLPCWPSKPLWDQIEGGADMARGGINLEITDGPTPSARHLVRGQDFDQVVLAISIAAVPAVSAELLADQDRPRFGEMVAGSRTCMTQGIQLWMTKTVQELGWTEAAEMYSTYVEPIDTYCDMSQLIPVEDWPDAANVESIAYLVGVLRDEDGDTDTSTADRVRAGMAPFVQDNAGRQWPAAFRNGRFDWNLLVAPDGTEGEARLDAQFWRANYAPSERYVLTPAGSVGSRLTGDEAGWSNLVLAGDWTRTGLNLGCVESAVMSGMQAARAISGFPPRVVGEDSAFLGNAAGATEWVRSC